MLTLIVFKGRLQIHVSKGGETKDDIHVSLVLANESRNVSVELSLVSGASREWIRALKVGVQLSW